jgi:hypothetical protein
MKIFQIFKQYIETSDLILILNCFDIKYKEGEDIHALLFSKTDLSKHKTVEKLNSIKDVFYKYYIPCKAVKYVENLNEKKAITILRHVLRLISYNLESIEKNVNNKKIIFYCIKRNDMPPVNLRLNSEETTMSFD